MKKQYICINRIVVNYKGNPLKASPIGILQEFFNYATAAEHAKAFDAFCLAALSNQYSWRRGSPGNALFYSEQLELLIEAAYLLHQQPELKGRRFKMLRDTLQSFFNYASLAKWKKRHYAFTHAALSNSSVADELPATVIYKHIAYMKRLVTAAEEIILANH